MQKEKYAIRKFKTGVHSAYFGKIVVMGFATVALATGGQLVSADETILTPATEMVVQPAINGDVETVVSDSLNKAVTEAKEAGVEVKEQPQVVYETKESAQSDLEKQTVAVKKATEKAKANTEAISKAEATNAEIDRQNEAEKLRIEELNKQGQEAVDKRNAEGQAETDRLNKQAQSDYEAELARIDAIKADNVAIRERNKKAQEEADRLNAEAEAKYQAALAEMEAKTKEEGYATKALTQFLDLAEDEANSIVTLSGAKKFVTETTVQDPYLLSQDILNGKTNTVSEVTKIAIPNKYTWIEYAMVVGSGQTVTATFTGLEKTTYNYKKVSKIEMTIKPISTDGTDLVVFLSDKLTNGYEVYSAVSGQKEEVTLRFFDDNGKTIPFSKEAPALFGFGSLNRHTGSIEYISEYNFEFVPINGSTIVEHEDGVYSDGDNDYKANGSKYDFQEWDPDGSPLAYYGAGIGVVTAGDTIRFTGGNKEFRGHWTDITSVLTSPVVPAKPEKVTITPELEKEVPPTPPTPLVLTFKPEVYIPLLPEEKHRVQVPEKETFEFTIHPVAVKKELPPTPAKPTPPAPKAVLPQTGADTGVALSSIGLLFLTMFGWLGLAKRKEQE